MKFNIDLFYINGKLNNYRIKESYIKNEWPDEYYKIVNYHAAYFRDIKIKFTQKLYNYIYKIDSVQLCPVCGKKLKFNKFTKGYKSFCSIKCSANSSITQCKRIDNVNTKASAEKRKETNLERYGGHPMQNKEIKEKVEKTNLERYGVINPYKSKIIKDKIKETNLERYGAINPAQSKIVQSKYKETNLERYGGHPMQNKEIKEKVEKTNLERYGYKCSLLNKEIKEKVEKTNLERYGGHPMQNKKIKEKTKLKYDLNYIKKLSAELNLNILSHNNGQLMIKCDKCKNIYTIQTQLVRLRRNLNVDICTNCNKLFTYNINSLEKLIQDFLNSLDIKFENNNRTILNGLELDIYIPEKNVAIEINGLYWHSELFKDKNYHLNKTIECEKQGIQLIHIFEDELKYNEKNIKSRIKNILGITENKIFARKTEVREVSSKTGKDFLNENHIQGSINSKINLGLYYNNELVSLMTFGGLRKALGQNKKENVFELLRFCNKLDTTVVGGASKLFNHFIKEYNPEKVISYADRRWSTGNLYRQLGFEEGKPSKPNYWYIKDSTREYRFKYRKSELIKGGFDKEKSEHEIMSERRINRIYDCGNLKFIYNNLHNN